MVHGMWTQRWKIAIELYLDGGKVDGWIDYTNLLKHNAICLRDNTL